MPTSYEKYAEYDPPDNVGVIDVELVQKKRGFWGTCGFSLLFVFLTLLAATGVFFITLGVGSYPVVTAVTPELAKRQAYGDEHSIVTISLPVFSTANTGYPSTVVQEPTTSSSAHTTTTTTETTQVTETTTAATTSEESVSFGTITTPEGSVMSHTSLATIVDTSVATYLSTSVATHVNASTIPAAVSSSALTHSTSNAFSVTVTRTVVPIMGTSTKSLVNSTRTVTSATTSAPLGNGTIVHPTPSLSSSFSSPELVTTVFQNSTALSTVHASETGTGGSESSVSSTGTAYGGPPVQTSYATPSSALSGVTNSTASTRAVGSTRSTTVTTTVSTSSNCTTTSGGWTSTFIYTTVTRTVGKTSTVVVIQTPTRTSTIVSNDAVTASGYGSISTEVPGTTHAITTSQLPTITVSTSVSYSHTPSPSTVHTSTVPVQPTSDSDDEGFASTVTVTFTPTSLTPIVVTETTVATIESSCSPTVSHVTTTETAQGSRTTVFVPQILTHTAMAPCSLSSTTITETVVHTVYPSELTSATAASTTTATTVRAASSTGAVGGGGGAYSYSESAGFTVEGSTHSASTSTPHILTSVSTWTSTTVHGSPSIITTVSKPAIPTVSISPNSTATVTWIPFETGVETGTTSSCANSTQTVFYTPPVSPSFGSNIVVSAMWSTSVARASSGVGVESVGNPTATATSTSTCTSSTKTAPHNSGVTATMTQSVPSNGTTSSSHHTTITNTKAFPSVIDASEAATEVTMTGVFGNVTFTITGATGATGATGGVVSATTGGHHGGGGAPNATATVVPVVSDGGDTVKPARLYWGDTNGGSSNACVVMVVAFVCAVMVLF
ncbi:hypothetical protein DL769_001947 [Monosporascus sp. CRB-8-3]|nr:hypothetical protein DL769_001947 [Monosporascus sp. CRB-8-3]